MFGLCHYYNWIAICNEHNSVDRQSHTARRATAETTETHRYTIHLWFQDVNLVNLWFTNRSRNPHLQEYQNGCPEKLRLFDVAVRMG